MRRLWSRLGFYRNSFHYFNKLKAPCSLYVATYMVAGSSLLFYSTSTIPLYADFEEERKVKDQIRTDYKLTKRELRFLQFASIEYNDIIYMSPMDFIDSLTLDGPRERVYRRVLNDKDLKQVLSRTPPFRCGSKDLFRTLDQNGLISYSEYIFLLTLLTKSKTAFKIAFLMFDNDDNGRIDKDEFILIRSLMTALRSTRGFQTDSSIGNDSCQLDLSDYHFVASRLHRKLITGIDAYPIIFTISKMFASRAAQLQGTRLVPKSDESKNQDTTLLMHLFGLRGHDKLSFEEFRQFYQNLQEELMEIEFHEFARGKNTISPMDFARLILRYTIVNQDDYHNYILRVKERSTYEDKGVTLGQWARFSVFLNNLEEFATAVRLYTNANIPVSQLEFTRAVKSTTGQDLDPNVVQLIFRIFDVNNDGTLSYSEFLAVMNDRLHRGLKGRLDKPWGWKQFKNCVMNELSRF